MTQHRITPSTVVLTCCIALFVACDAGAAGQTSPEESAAAQYRELFGSREEAVLRTRGTADDLALAQELLTTASLDGLTDALRRLLCERALALATNDPQGFETADAALDRLNTIPGSDPLVVLQQRADLYFKRWSALRGDAKAQFAASAYNALADLANAQEAALELEAAQLTWRRAATTAAGLSKDARDQVRDANTRLTARTRQMRALERVIAVYEANPRADLASRIARTYLVEFDAPGHGLLYAAAGDDEQVKRFLPVIAGPIEEMPLDLAIALGEWLEALVRDAPDPVAKAALLSRADGAYSTFLDSAIEENFEVAKARVAQSRVAKALGELGITTGHISGGIDLMPTVGNNLHLMITGDHSRRQHWTVDAQRKQLVGQMGNEDRFTGHPLNLPLRASGDYQFTTRLGIESRYAVIVMPVGDKLARFIYTAGPETQIGGSAQVNRENNVANGTFDLTGPASAPGQIRKLHFDVRTRERVAGIVVKIDDQIAFQWQGPYAGFNVGPNEKFELASPFAIAPPRNGSIRIEALNARGAVRLIRPTGD